MNKSLEQYMPDGSKLPYRFMKYRIHKILLVCCSYDGYILEEDGHIESQINQEYIDLNMSNPPSLTRVSSTAEALEALDRDDSFDFILTMYNVGEPDVFSFAKIVKERHPNTPVALLTSFSKDIYRRIEEQDRSGLDYIFSWHGNTELIIAIIKLIEDKMNADEDIREGGVQAILLVEDSIRFYSTYLPEIYKLLLLQNTEFLKDAFNEQQQVLRKRARPKILLARCYEEAVELYERYKKNLLGVISDVGFVLRRNDPPESEKLDAGIDLCRRIREDNPLMPVLLQSSQVAFGKQAAELGAGFIAKNSKTLLSQLHDYIAKEFAFGDFVFKDPDTGAEIGRAKDLTQMQQMIATIPDRAFEYHTSQNHLSKWLYSRGLFPLASSIRQYNKSHFSSVEEHRRVLVGLIRDYRTLLGAGRRGAFRHRDLLRRRGLRAHRRGFARRQGPRLGVYELDAYETPPVRQARKRAHHDPAVGGHRHGVLRRLHPPQRTEIHHLAGFFRRGDPLGIRQLGTPVPVARGAEKLHPHRAHAAGHPLVVEARRLALPALRRHLLDLHDPLRRQRGPDAAPAAQGGQKRLRLGLFRGVEGLHPVVAEPHLGGEDGRDHPGSVRHGAGRGCTSPPVRAWPARSTTTPSATNARRTASATSPWGLGKLVVDGGRTLRFSPRYPQKVLQTSTPELALRDTQNEVLALSLRPEEFRTSIDDAVNLRRLGLTQIGGFRNSKFVCSVWDRENERISDSPFDQGRKVITFNNILKYNTFPLAEIISDILTMGAEEMRCPVEVEFAVNMDVAPGQRQVFNLLQIRPIIDNQDNRSIDWNEVDASRALIYGEQALGIGQMTDIADIIYVKSEAFDSLSTEKIAEELLTLNNRMRDQGRPYILVGPGRWGSSDPFLGVPVKWNHISEARVIVECGIEKFDVEPSQGTHFFQNVTSLGVGYLTINPFRGDGLFREKELDARQALYDGTYLRQVRFDSPLWVCIDGRSNKGMVREGKND